MNNKLIGKEVINLLQSHRSIRQFTEKKITEEILEELLISARSAPSSSHGQAYSIINITTSEKKEKLADYAGNQQQVRECSNFLVFCADLNRLANIATAEEVEMQEALDSTEMFLISTIDAALVAQNLAVAAQSLGLGIVYTGGIRNNPAEVSNLLKLPFRVYPIFGMCIGYPVPSKIPETKPRLPLSVICHKEEYKPYESIKHEIKQYDEKMRDYYLSRTQGSRGDTWSHTMTDKRKVPRRMFMKKFLNEKGFPLK